MYAIRRQPASASRNCPRTSATRSASVSGVQSSVGIGGRTTTRIVAGRRDMTEARCPRCSLEFTRAAAESLARRKFPGSPASLDALCKRFNIDNSARSLHGALLDAELLAEVYLELIGGRQAGLDLVQAEARAAAAAAGLGPSRPPRPHAPTPEELVAWAAMLAKIKEPLWNN